MNNFCKDFVSPLASKWHLANPWNGIDHFLTLRALDIHYDLVKSKKLKIDSQKYYDEIDKRIYKFCKKRLKKYFSMDN